MSRDSLHCGAWAPHSGGFSCCMTPALGAQASTVVVAPGLRCSTAHAVFLDQGSKAMSPAVAGDSYPLHTLRSPWCCFCAGGQVEGLEPNLVIHLQFLDLRGRPGEWTQGSQLCLESDPGLLDNGRGRARLSLSATCMKFSPGGSLQHQLKDPELQPRGSFTCNHGPQWTILRMGW